MKKKANPSPSKPKPAETLLCWHAGQRLLKEHLQGSRTAYGKQILVTVSRELTVEYGHGFSYAEIARMIQPSRVGTFLCPRGQRRLFPREHKNRAHPTRLHQAIEHAREQAARRLPNSVGQP